MFTNILIIIGLWFCVGLLVAVIASYTEQYFYGIKLTTEIKIAMICTGLIGVYCLVVSVYAGIRFRIFANRLFKMHDAVSKMVDDAMKKKGNKDDKNKTETN